MCSAHFYTPFFYKEKGMKRVYFLNVLLVLLIVFTMAGCKKTYKYNPETKEELKALVDNKSISLGDIDTSKITDMSELFMESFRDDFTGIEKWNVSNVDNMSCMFLYARKFNGDISSWNVSNVKNMQGMFAFASNFNQDISNWNVFNVEDMSGMFAYAKSFNQPIGS